MRLRFLASITVLVACGTATAQTKPGANAPAEIAATVNGESISVAELDTVLNANLPAAPLTAAQRRQLRAALLNDLIDDKLLKQFLTKNGAKADPAEIDAQMAVLKARLVKENRTLADYLKQTGQTESQLRDDWATQIRLANYVKAQATDDKLKAYFAANRDYFDKVEVRVSHIVIRLGRNASPVERAAAKEKLQAIRADLVDRSYLARQGIAHVGHTSPWPYADVLAVFEKTNIFRASGFEWRYVAKEPAALPQIH